MKALLTSNELEIKAVDEALESIQFFVQNFKLASAE